MGRTNRRARTDAPIRDNRIYDIRLLSDGYYVGRSDAAYYRRHIGSQVFTGSVEDAAKIPR